MGIVHRDVKPANILVEKYDNGEYRPFVMDFGLARIIGEQGETVTGHIAGTPAYMAPEQARGEIRSLDRRTDVYSLGATFYDILAERRPFVDDQPWRVLMRISTEDVPPLASVCRNVPIDIETIVMKCLERDPGRRYESARALGEDLRRYLNGDPVLARKSSVSYRLLKWARKHKLLVAAIFTVFVVATSLVVIGVRARQIAAEQARIAHDLGEDVKEMPIFMRYAHALPTHDIERERIVVRKRIEEIKARMLDAGASGESTGHYALGQGYLALEEPEIALAHLQTAHATGYTTPEFEYAYGHALVQVNQGKLEEIRRIPDTTKQAAALVEVDAA